MSSKLQKKLQKEFGYNSYNHIAWQRLYNADAIAKENKTDAKTVRSILGNILKERDNEQKQ